MDEKDTQNQEAKKVTESAEDVRRPVQNRVVPPDGGWGWVVMIASFCCNIVVDGIIFSFGLIVSQLSESFHVPISKTAWVGSLLSGFYLIAGPFVSALSNRYGFRTVTIVGSVLGATSLSLSIFATSVEFLYVTVGIIGGIGFGLVYVPSVIAVGFYFEKKRALATGIAVCGSGIGTFVIAPLTSWLLEEYGWKGTILIHAGMILNCAVFGAMFRPLEAKKTSSNRAAVAMDDICEMAAVTPLMVRVRRDEDVVKNGNGASVNGNSINRSSEHRSSTSSLGAVKLVGIKPKRSDSSSSEQRKMDTEELLEQNTKAVIVRTSSKQSVHSNKNMSMDIPMTRLDKQNDVDHQKHHSTNGHADVKEEEVEPEKTGLASIIDLTLFKSMTFNVICLSGFITFLGFFVPFMFLAARAVDTGVDKESASFLLSIIGVTNTVGRVACGALSDHPKVNVLFVNNFALTVGGLVTMLTPLFPSYNMLMVYSAIFGLAIACFASLRSIMVIEFLGLENLTNAFGLTLLFTGISATLGGPLAGMFYDATKNYDYSFFLSGSMILLSAILCYPLGYINRWEKAKKSDNSAKTSCNA